MGRKKQYEVGDNETITDCLCRMDNDGYRPVRRMEKPIFQEKKDQDVEVMYQQIVFEAVQK